tara:strand:- start:93 stop:362 length:270 start_codon:yes stop_codon:yes gene_type:complete
MQIEKQFNPEQLHWIHYLIRMVEKFGHQLSYRLDWHRGWISELKEQFKDQKVQIKGLKDQVKELKYQVKELQILIAQLTQANRPKVYDW